jgi:hypothetical protein
MNYARSNAPAAKAHQSLFFYSPPLAASSCIKNFALRINLNKLQLFIIGGRVAVRGWQ